MAIYDLPFYQIRWQRVTQCSSSSSLMKTVMMDYITPKDERRFSNPSTVFFSVLS
uniref:Uncharacterized protein n=1 Tax=Candidatus Kentrum sp. FW TaxID=2126338 RepID=A0A450T6M7_9GAMM|nr:MAG: hypothetical protein BECKFW1821A_GA0114235_11101 [Candidatus Kentron sp. FW]VFJ62447.1 MAG: hypothetical protein BECKFW1821B_GA0114236_10745 [Candidatus Kentron sp. FW]